MFSLPNFTFNYINCVKPFRSGSVRTKQRTAYTTLSSIMFPVSLSRIRCYTYDVANAASGGPIYLHVTTSMDVDHTLENDDV